MKFGYYVIFAAAVLCLCTQCQKKPEGKDVEVKEAQGAEAQKPETLSIPVDVKASEVKWTGTKKTGKHNGTLKISKGSLSLSEGKVVGGEFELDMKTIEVADLKGEEKTKLEGHLKTKDFFLVDSFPTGKFVISKVEEAKGEGGATHSISGDLTLKKITKNITFPAKIEMDAATKTFKATTQAIKINRTLWDIKYNSGPSFADKMIYDDILLDLSIVAKQ